MKAMVEGKRRAILDDVVLGVGADEVVHASLDATYAGAPNLRCPSASNAHEESTMNETQDVDVLNQGLQGEYFGIAAYDAALGTKLLSDKVAVVARGFQADHRAHAQAIREAIERLGGRADAAKTWAEYAAQYPPPKLASEADVLRYAASLERSAAIADTKAVARSMIRLCGRRSHGSAVSRPCTGRSFVRPSGSRRFRTVSFRLNEQHRFRRYIPSEAGGASRSAEKTPDRLRKHFRNAAIREVRLQKRIDSREVTDEGDRGDG